MIHQDIKYPHLFKVIYIGFCFLLLFSAFISAQNLITPLYTQLGFPNLGQICIFTIYIALAISSIFASSIQRKHSFKFTLVLSSAGYAVFLGVGYWANYCQTIQPNLFCTPGFIYGANVGSSALLGASGGVLWLAQSHYLNLCANQKVKGLYNGIFWSLMQFSQIIGFVVGAYILGAFNQMTFFMFMCFVSCIASILLLFLPKMEANRLEDKKENQSFVMIKKEFQEKRNRNFIPTFFYSGIIIGAYTTYFNLLIPSTISSSSMNIIDQDTAIIFAILGVGETLAGIVLGPLLDRFNKFSVLNGVYFISALAIASTFGIILTDSFFLAGVAAFFWGFSDCGNNTVVTAIIGAHFNGKLELFGIFRLAQGFGVVLACTLSILLQNQTLYLFISCVTGIQVICNFYSIKLKNQFDKDKSQLALEDTLIVDQCQIQLWSIFCWPVILLKLFFITQKFKISILNSIFQYLRQDQLVA